MRTTHSRSIAATLCLALVLAVLPSCNRAYLKTMDTFGYEKREVLVNRVAEARDAQKDLREKLQEELQVLRAVASGEAGDEEERYKKVERAQEKSNESAEDARDRLQAVERVSETLFREWAKELEDYSDQDLRAQSERKLEEGRASLERVLVALRAVDERAKPVLATLQDQVLFLKHDRSTTAATAIQPRIGLVETSLRDLDNTLGAAIEACDAFLASSPAS